MGGFEKINLDTPSTLSTGDPLTKQSMPKKVFNFDLSKKNTRILIGGAILLLLFVVFGVILPFRKTYSDLKQTQTDAQAAIYGLKTENIQIASDMLTKTQKDLLQNQKDLGEMVYLKFIPPFTFYYLDAAHLLQAGIYGVNAGQIFVNAVKPYADVLGLKGGGSFTGGSAQQRIQLAVTTMSKVTPRIDDIQSQLALAREEIDQVDPNHFPSLFGLKKIHDQLVQIKKFADGGTTFISQAKSLVKVLPALLGEPDTKKYLILFQNDKEIRPTGGFITAYAIFSLTHGVIHVDTSSDIYSLDDTIPNKPTAPRPILLYLPQVPQWNIRDTNLSPDFVVSMKDFAKMYKSSGSSPVDGIIAIDTYVLVDAMKVLGNIDTDGITFTTKTDPSCNCPQVIYQLEAITDQPVEFQRSNRKGIIGDLMYAIMQKAFSSSPKLYWGPLFQGLVGDIAQKHVLFSINNTDAQSGLASLNATGQILPFDGDYLHINDTNFGGAKSNLFLSEAVSQNYQVQGDGSIQKTVTIKYKNPFPPSDCNLERGNLCLNAIQRDFLRIYVPQGSKMITSQGSEVKMTNYDELGKTVFEGFLTIRPLGTATFTITYTLPFKVANNSPLPLMIQKQPGTNNNQYTISIGGNQIQQLQLVTDQTLKLNVH